MEVRGVTGLSVILEQGFQSHLAVNSDKLIKGLDSAFIPLFANSFVFAEIFDGRIVSMPAFHAIKDSSSGHTNLVVPDLPHEQGSAKRAVILQENFELINEASHDLNATSVFPNESDVLHNSRVLSVGLSWVVEPSMDEGTELVLGNRWEIHGGVFKHILVNLFFNNKLRNVTGKLLSGFPVFTN